MKHLRGFTFIELIVAVAILGILAGVALPVYTNYVVRSRVSEMLVSMSRARSCVQEWNQDRFRLPGVGSIASTDLKTVHYSSNVRWDGRAVVVDANPDNLGAELTISLVAELGSVTQGEIITGWTCAVTDPSMFRRVPSNCRNLYSGNTNSAGHVLLGSEVTMGEGGHTGFVKGSYSGSAKDIVFPQTVDKTTITNIYQDVFSNKEITKITFDANSEVTRIHARAFQNNNLTEITLADSIKRVDYGAFLNNNITKVTIGSGVVLESKVFQNNDDFRAAYTTQGAGTYFYVDDNWIKQ